MCSEFYVTLVAYWNMETHNQFMHPWNKATYTSTDNKVNSCMYKFTELNIYHYHDILSTTGYQRTNGVIFGINSIEKTLFDRKCISSWNGICKPKCQKYCHLTASNCYFMKFFDWFSLEGDTRGRVSQSGPMIHVLAYSSVRHAQFPCIIQHTHSMCTRNMAT
jgi:hypothetical protein